MECKAGNAMPESYKEYKKIHNNTKSMYYLTSSQYNKIIKLYCEKLAYYLITTGEEIELFSRLGKLVVCKTRLKKRPIDFRKTRQLYGEYNKGKSVTEMKTVYYTNQASNNYFPVVKWLRSKQQSFRNKFSYIFKFSRPNLYPNTYNKTNPKVSLHPFFFDKGMYIYRAL